MKSEKWVQLAWKNPFLQLHFQNPKSFKKPEIHECVYFALKYYLDCRFGWWGPPAAATPSCRYMESISVFPPACSWLTLAGEWRRPSSDGRWNFRLFLTAQFCDYFGVRRLGVYSRRGPPTHVFYVVSTSWPTVDFPENTATESQISFSGLANSFNFFNRFKISV